MSDKKFIVYCEYLVKPKALEPIIKMKRFQVFAQTATLTEVNTWANDKNENLILDSIYIKQED